MTTITDIYDTIPGYAQLGEQLAWVQARLNQFRAAPAPAGRVVTRHSLAVDAILAAAAAGAPDTDCDLVVIVGDRLRRTEDEGATVEGLAGAVDRLKAERASVLASNADAILTGCDGIVARFQTQAETLGPLGQIQTREAAMASERYEDHKRLQQLLAEYTDVRREQVRILRDRLGETFAGKTAICAFISNLADVFPLWAIWVMPGVLTHVRRQEDKPLPAPWPAQPQTHHSEFALWALQHGARLWVPTLEEYQTAATKLRADARAPRAAYRDGDWVDPASLPTKARRSAHGVRR